MQFLCKRKISLHSSSPLHEYPSVRLPREFKALIGKTASVYIDEDTDKLTFKVVIDKKVDKVCANSEQSHDETRLAAAESQIAELKSLPLLNESASFSKNENRWARGDSNARSPRVRAEDSGLITTRKAVAPL